MSDPIPLREILAATLDDTRVSRSERKALRQVLEDRGVTANQRDALRHEAFELARHRVCDPRDRELLDWLDDVLKVLRPEAPPAPAQVEAWFSPRDDCVEPLVRLFESARRSVDACVFTITDNRIARAMVAAHRRGVAVRVISDNDKTLDRGSDVIALSEAGIEVRIDNTAHHMHHKFAIFDQTQLLTGSYNWTRSAARDNCENLLVTDDQRLVKAFRQEFERLWSAFV